MEVAALNLETEELLEPSAQIYRAITEAANEGVVADLSSEEDEETTFLRQDLEHYKRLPFLKRPSIWQIVFICAAITTFLSAAEPFRQQIMFQLACNSVEIRHRCDPALTQLLISDYNQYAMVGMTLISLFGVSIFGYSDIVGRKPFLVVTLAMFTISRMLELYLMTHFDTFQFIPLVLASYVSALSGGYLIIGSIMDSYISDICLAQDRTQALALGASGSYIGQSIGPVLGAYLGRIAKSFDPNTGLPAGEVHLSSKLTESSKIAESDYFLLKIEVVVFLLTTLYSLFLLPESRSVKVRAKSRSMSQSLSISQARAQLLVAQSSTQPTLASRAQSMMQMALKIFEPLKVLLVPKEVTSASSRHRIFRLRYMVIILTTTTVTYQTLILSLGQVLLQYGVFKFEWGSSEISILLTVTAVTKCFALVVVLPFYQNTVLQIWLGFKVLKTQMDLVDLITMITSLLMDFAIFVLLYFAKSSRDMFVLCGFLCLGGFLGPVSISTILKTVTKIGPLFAANALLLNIVSIVSPIAILGVYKGLVSHDRVSEIFLVYAAAMPISIAAIYSCKFVLGLNRGTTDESLKRRESALSEN
ncbi:uncharacterized protein LODBEIA_P09440 [Lodderomyces beijingensis]|uniref:Major facilitator superfamily (MFS) profile domain-containing protein n=1 Tax=Lodderomyces beijingensis TaxID=1775926 RepID=A0ABP0ZKA8_9ASCO